MRHLIVRHDAGVFYAWPANCGLWTWGDEIAVGFTRGVYSDQSENHSVDLDRPQDCVIARSLDGGESWDFEEPDNFPEGHAFGEQKPEGPVAALEGPLDFTHPDLAIRCRRSELLVSMDRGHTWQGPYGLPGLDPGGVLTSRSDYLAVGAEEALFFVSVRPRQAMGSTRLPDRAFVARTRDGGRTFEQGAWMLPEDPRMRSVMPSTVRLASGKLVSALRRRRDTDDGAQETWVDTAESMDGGSTWRHLSRVATTQDAQIRRNGNPPSAVLLSDGRLAVVYGFRKPAMGGIRARLSADEGKTWGEEIVLRDDARTWDIGYPRSAARADGTIVSVYYFTTEERREQHIAATIWDPDTP